MAGPRQACSQLVNEDLARKCRLGGLIGSNPYAGGTFSGFPMRAPLWDPSQSANSFMQPIEMISGGTNPASRNRGIRLIARNDGVPQSTLPSWYSIPWLGELAPDNDGTWSASGNLSSVTYYRALYTDLMPADNGPHGVFHQDRETEMHWDGAPTFLNGNPSGDASTAYWTELLSVTGAPSNLTATGTNAAGALKLVLPATTGLCRPFTLSGAIPDPYGDYFLDSSYFDPIYQSQRTTTSMLEGPYHDSPDPNYPNGTGVIAVSSGSSVGYLMSNGLCPQGATGVYTLSTVGLVGSLRGYMAAGSPSAPFGHVVQLPRLTISQPVQGANFDSSVNSVTVNWSYTWRRWDGQPYTEIYPPSFSEGAPPPFILKYSSDNGHTWYYGSDNSPNAQPGNFMVGKTVSSPFAWDISSVPSGTYVLRLEAYRPGLPLHYAYHETAISILR
jgi:hypothetical protein